MPTFAYTALKSDGTTTKGELQAGDRSEAMRKLGRGGMQPVALSEKGGGVATAPPPKAKEKPKPEPKAEKPAPAAKLPNKPTKAAPEEAEEKKPVLATGPVKLKRSLVVLFTEELSDLLGAGLQLEPALKIMESRDELSNLKTVATLIRQQVRDGASFSSALRNASPSFGELYCSLAAAGEVSGALPLILKRQATYLVKLAELQSKVVTAMIYPAVLFVAVVGVSVLFVSVLMPQLVGLLEEMGRPLPAAAKFMLGLSAFLKSYWWAVLIVIVGAIMGFRKLVSVPPYEAKWHEQKLKLPLLGGMFARRFYVQFLETLGNLVGNGLPLLKGLELTRNATQNLYGRALLDETIAAVGEGAALSRTLRRVGFFPPILTDMIAVGEQTGDLPTALNRAAERFDKELEKVIEKLSALMQPVILVILACMVGPMAYIMIQVIIESMQGMDSRGV